jgi:hypothetical protein
MASGRRVSQGYHPIFRAFFACRSTKTADLRGIIGLHDLVRLRRREKFMKKAFLGVAVCVCLLVPSVSAAAPSLLVTGAGASTTSGHVVVNARATGAAVGPFIPVAPATGSVRVRGSFFGDLSGSVTCIGLAGPNAAVVSGNLDTPFTSGGFTFANFSLLLITTNAQLRSWISFAPNNLGAAFPCGTSLFFTFGVPNLPNDFVVNGRFTILGAA